MGRGILVFGTPFRCEEQRQWDTSVRPTVRADSAAAYFGTGGLRVKALKQNHAMPTRSPLTANRALHCRLRRHPTFSGVSR